MDEHLLVFCSWEWKVMYLEHIWIKLFRFLFKHRKYDQFHIWKAVRRVVRTLASKPRGSIPVDLYLFMMNLAIICPYLISYMQHHISYQRKKDSNLAWDSACIRHIFKDNDTNWVCKAYFLIWMWKCASHKKLPMNLNVNCTRNISICKQWHNYKYELVGLMQN